LRKAFSIVPSAVIASERAIVEALHQMARVDMRIPKFVKKIL